MPARTPSEERLVAGLWRRFRDADLSILAAAVAYNTFLALVPLTLALVGVASFLGGDQASLDRIERTLAAIAPDTVVQFITDLLRDSQERIGGAQAWVIVLSVLVALLLGARAVVALQKALAIVEDTTERRPATEMRIVAVGLTVGGGAALLLTSFLLVVGGRVIQFLVELTGFGALDTLWVWMRIPVSAIGLYAFLLAFYRWGPPEPLRRAWLAALVATTGSVLASLGFGAYLAAAPGLGATFGVLGAVAVALVWLYLGAFVILLGGVVVGYLDPWWDRMGGLVGSLRRRSGGGGGGDES